MLPYRSSLGTDVDVGPIPVDPSTPAQAPVTTVHTVSSGARVAQGAAFLFLAAVVAVPVGGLGYVGYRYGKKTGAVVGAGIGVGALYGLLLYVGRPV